jgi:MFS family permease
MTRHEANRVALAITPGVLLSGFAGGVAFPILPIAGRHAGLSLAFIGVILAANRAARVFANPFIGRLTDRIGGRRTLIAGLAIQIVVMALYALGVILGRPGPFFLVGRLLHGPASACVFVAGQALALEAGGDDHGGRTAGIVRAALAVGVPFGIVAGGLLSEWIGDAGTFEIALGALAVATVVAYFAVPDLRTASRRVVPMLETLRGFANRTLATIGALNFAATFSASGMVLTTLVLLVHDRNLSVFHMGDRGSSGALMGWMLLTESVTMPFAGALGDRLRVHARVAALGLMVLVPGLAIVGLWQTSTGLACGLGLIGVGGGALGPSLLALLGREVRGGERGVAVGMLQLCGDVGGTLGPLIGTALLATNLTTPYLVSAGLTALALPLAISLARRERSLDKGKGGKASCGRPSLPFGATPRP